MLLFSALLSLKSGYTVIQDTSFLQTFRHKLNAIIKLTRWRQHVPYTIPLVLAGGLMASSQSGISLDWRLLAILLANILAMSFAFMINDVIDAPDDARDPIKTKSNIISQGLLTIHEAYLLCGIIFITSSALFFLGGSLPFLVGLGTLFLSLFYSMPPLRLKARPIVDVLAHVLMLSAFLLLSSYLAYDTKLLAGWWVILAVTFASAYGQFYNQVDDFETDKQAGLNNTAILIGKQYSIRLMQVSALLTIVCFISAILSNVFPLWLIWVLGITVITLALFRWDIDMRGNQADASGMVQRPVLITANIVVLIWLLDSLSLLGIS